MSLLINFTERFLSTAVAQNVVVQALDAIQTCLLALTRVDNNMADFPKNRKFTEGSTNC